MKLSAKPVRLPAADISRHYHSRPYATLVLEGSYEEAGDQGRYFVAAGDILLHPAFSAHWDHVLDARTFVLDVPLPFDARSWPGLGRVRSADLLVRTAARDLREAQQLLMEEFVARARHEGDPADELADALSHDPCLLIGRWAAVNGYSREWLSRRFSRMYGVASAVFRAEARSRLAWSRIVNTHERLAEVAAECGFADQSHMTRAIRQLTARTPRWWRDRSVTSVQEDSDTVR